MSTKTTAPVGEGFNLNEYINYAEDAVVSKTLIDKGIGNITLFSFDKGQGLSEHTAPFDALVHIIEGEAQIHISGVQHDLKAGDIIIMPAQEPHAVYSVTRFKMILTMIRSK